MMWLWCFISYIILVLSLWFLNFKLWLHFLNFNCIKHLLDPWERALYKYYYCLIVIIICSFNSEMVTVNRPPTKCFQTFWVLFFVLALEAVTIAVINTVNSLRKQSTFGDTTTSFPAKRRLRNECRNSILMTHHYPDLNRASDLLCRVGNLIQPIRSPTQIWVVTHHQYEISARVSQTSFGQETSGSIAKCRLFSQATLAAKHLSCMYSSLSITVVLCKMPVTD